MEQIGTVIKIDFDTAVVEVMRVSACGENCAHCKGGCVPTKVNAAAENRIGASVGDRVKIETSDMAVIGASVLLYFVPCILAIFGAVICQSVLANGTITVAVAAAMFFLSFFVIHKFDEKLAPKPCIVKILKEGQVS